MLGSSEKLRDVPEPASAKPAHEFEGDMSRKQDARKLRSEAHRRALVHRTRTQRARSQVVMVATVLTASTAIILRATRRRDAVRVWSAVLGNWQGT